MICTADVSVTCPTVRYYKFEERSAAEVVIVYLKAETGVSSGRHACCFGHGDGGSGGDDEVEAEGGKGWVSANIEELDIEVGSGEVVVIESRVVDGVGAGGGSASAAGIAGTVDLIGTVEIAEIEAKHVPAIVSSNLAGIKAHAGPPSKIARTIRSDRVAIAARKAVVVDLYLHPEVVKSPILNDLAQRTDSVLRGR
jgi:hypothetical protein